MSLADSCCQPEVEPKAHEVKVVDDVLVPPEGKVVAYEASCAKTAHGRICGMELIDGYFTETPATYTRRFTQLYPGPTPTWRRYALISGVGGTIRTNARRFRKEL
jgi:hypothetical protein